MAQLASLKRYLILIQKVKSKRYLTKAELLQYLNEQLKYEENTDKGISVRTLERMIGDIRSFMDISIEYCHKNKGYHIPEDEERESIVEKILEPLNLLYATIGAKRLPEYIYPEKRRSVGTEFMADIMNAIKENRNLSIRYAKFYPEVTEERLIQPHALKESRGRWYVLAFEKGNDVLKSYGLDRILDLEVLNSKFTPRDNLDVQAKYRHCFAMFTSDEEPQMIKLSFDERDGHYIQTMPIHASQKIYKEGNRVIVELFMSITLDLIMELMSRTWSIEVIAPQSLKDEFCRIYREALDRNSR